MFLKRGYEFSRKKPNDWANDREGNFGIAQVGNTKSNWAKNHNQRIHTQRKTIQFWNEIINREVTWKARWWFRWKLGSASSWWSQDRVRCKLRALGENPWCNKRVLPLLVPLLRGWNVLSIIISNVFIIIVSHEVHISINNSDSWWCDVQTYNYSGSTLMVLGDSERKVWGVNFFKSVSDVLYNLLLSWSSLEKIWYTGIPKIQMRPYCHI